MSLLFYLSTPLSRLCRDGVGAAAGGGEVKLHDKQGRIPSAMAEGILCVGARIAYTGYGGLHPSIAAVLFLLLPKTTY